MEMKECTCSVNYTLDLVRMWVCHDFTSIHGHPNVTSAVTPECVVNDVYFFGAFWLDFEAGSVNFYNSIKLSFGMILLFHIDVLVIRCPQGHCTRDLFDVCSSVWRAQLWSINIKYRIGSYKSEFHGCGVGVVANICNLCFCKVFIIIYHVTVSPQIKIQTSPRYRS